MIPIAVIVSAILITVGFYLWALVGGILALRDELNTEGWMMKSAVSALCFGYLSAGVTVLLLIVAVLQRLDG